MQKFDVVFKKSSERGYRLCGHVEKIHFENITIRWNHYRSNGCVIMHGGTANYNKGKELNTFLKRFEIISGITSVKEAEICIIALRKLL